MSDNNETRVPDQGAMSESEIQERKLREEFKAKKRNKRIKKLVIWLVVLAVIFFIGVWYFDFRADVRAQMQAAQAANTTVETQVTRSVYTAEIDLSGYVEAYDIQQARFRATGPVTGVFVEEGDVVEEGQLLATIDNTNQTYQVEYIRDQLREAELSGSASQVELLNLQLKTAENNLEYTNLVANFAGTVAEVNIDQGDYFEAGTTTSSVTVADLSKLKATVEIDEIDMQYVTEGTTAYLTFDSLPGQTIPATVTYIPTLGTYSDQGIGVVAVELTIDDPPASLKPGYSFEGTIQSEGDVEMLLIPQAALTTGRGGVTTVEKKNADGTTTTVQVNVKYLGEGTCQVVSGDVAEGDTLVYRNTTSGGIMMMGGGGGPMGF